jgi:hypothetical protein
LPSPFYIGSTDDTPDPVSGLFGVPIFLDNAISNTLGTTANQDQIVAFRPSDFIFFEGQPQFTVGRDTLSGSLGAQLQLHNSVAAILNRHLTGIATLGGSALVYPSGY